MRPVRLVTYNLLHGLNVTRAGRLDLAAAAASIAVLDADIVALQEVDRGLTRTGESDQVAWLADRLGMHGLFAPALLGDPGTAWTTLDSDDTGDPGYGVGLLSRQRLHDARRLRLPGGGDGRRRRSGSPQRPGWDREPRVALRATVGATETGPDALTVTTTHLSYLPWRALRQLTHAARFAAAPRAALLGDLNLPAGSVRLSLRGWQHVRSEPTYPSPEPRLQVDQVLLRGLAPSRVEVARHTTSDHHALVVDVTVL